MISVRQALQVAHTDTAAGIRSALEVLEAARAEDGDVFLDLFRHRWRVRRHRVGYQLEGIGFQCTIPALLLPCIILVGLRPAPEVVDDTDPTDTVDERRKSA